MMRIGQGYDVHAFASEKAGDITDSAGSYVTLAGVCIPHPRPLLAHSDGDVLVHALCDALLGAAALGDIGRLFPDSDPRYREISSLVLLENVIARLESAGWILLNADMTLIAQAPKISPHVQAMVASLARTIGCLADQLSIKATTSEGLGAMGRGEGIAAQAVVLIQSMDGNAFQNGSAQ